MPESVAPPRSKWLKGASPDQPTHKVARNFLERRLLSVAYWVARSSEEGDDTVDAMPRLLASSNRAIEAVRAFSGFVDIENWEFLQVRLGEIREVAKEACDIDSIGGPFLRAVSEGAVDAAVCKVADIVSGQCKDTRLQIETLNNQLVADQFGDVIRATVDSVKSSKKGGTKRFGDYARGYFKPILKDFMIAVEDDLTEEETVHDIRIQAKRIRGSMEIVEVAFPPMFRSQLYPRITSLLRMMNQVNDHATARMLYRQWMSQDNDEQLKAFFQGVMIVAEKADEDIRSILLSTWSKAELARLKKRLKKQLKKQFKKCIKDSD